MLKRSLKKLKNKRLGEVLLDWGIIDKEQLAQALEIQKSGEAKGLKSGEILVKLGFVNEEAIFHAFNAQYSFPYLPLGNYEIDPAIIKTLPAELVCKRQVIPITKFGDVLSVAIANPLDFEALEEVEAVSGCMVQTFIASPWDIRETIIKYYTDLPNRPGWETSLNIEKA